MQLLKKVHNKNNNVMIFVTHDDRMAEYADKTIKFEDILVKEGSSND